MFRPFGTPATNSSAPFGTPQPSQQNSGFGFGTPGGFGAPTTQFGGASTGMGALPRYSPTNDLENNVTITLQTITAMPAYDKKSLEELRLEDYLAGRKGNSAPFGAVGQSVPSAGFGAASQPVSSAGFGAVNQPVSSAGFGTAAPSAFSSGGLFGAPATSTFGGNTGLFGTTQSVFGASNQPAQSQTQPTGFGAFGQPSSAIQQPTGGLFGATPAAQQQPTGGLFGATPAIQQQASTGFGTFGKPATTSTGFGSLGTQPGAPAAAGGGNFFGGSGGGSFGTLPSTTAPSSGLFSKPATTGFGFGSSTAPANPPPSTNLFGAPPAPQSTTGTGLYNFNAQPQSAATSGFNFGAPNQPTGLFGSAAPATSGFSFNLGGNQGIAQQSSVQQPSIQQPSAQPFSTQPFASTQSAAPSFSFSGATAAPTQQPFSGFSFNLGGNTATQTAPSLMPNTVAPPSNLPLISAESLSIKPPIPSALSTPKTTPGLGSANSTKTASISRSPARFTPRASFRLQPPSEVSFSTQSVTTAAAGSLVTSTGFVLPKRVSAKKLVVANNVPPTPGVGSRLASLSRVPSLEFPSYTESTPETFGEKFMIPNEATLRKLPYAQLCSVQSFTVGQRGVGQVRFIQPVDLTKISLNDIFERIVMFEPRLVTLYPDDEFPEDEKPSVGSGLNVAAEVRLERCWCVSKSDRQPIKDMGDPRLQAHIERLKGMPDTQFVDYLPESGTWVFRVQHFSSYGLAEGQVIVTPQESISKTVEWENNVLYHARGAYSNTGRRFSTCWLPDGSAIISRYRVSAIWTIFAPPTLPVDPIELDSAESSDIELEEALNLISILRTESEQDFVRWLHKRATSKFGNSNSIISAICRAEPKGIDELLSMTGLDRLSLMASIRSQETSSNIIDTLCTLASAQLELLPPTAPPSERFVLSLLAGKTIDDSELPWEGMLLAVMSYPKTELSIAVQRLEIKGDFIWNLLRYYVSGKMEHLLYAIQPIDTRDWTHSYIVAHSISLHDDILGSSILNIIRRHLAGQLLATGQWNLAIRLIKTSVGPFIKSNAELAQLPALHYYRQQENSAERTIGKKDLDCFKAWRAGYEGDLLGQFNSSMEAEMFSEAQDTATLILIPAVLMGNTKAIEEICQSLCSRVPSKEIFGLSKVCAFIWTEMIPREEVSVVVSQLLEFCPKNLYDKAVVSILAGMLSKVDCDASLIPLLTSDQRLSTLYQLTGREEPTS